jgi:hypothetical protein
MAAMESSDEEAVGEPTTQRKAKTRRRRKGAAATALAVMRAYAADRPNVVVAAAADKGRLARAARALEAGELVLADRGLFVLRRATGSALLTLCDGCAQPLGGGGGGYTCAHCPERYCGPCATPARRADHVRWCPVLRRVPALARTYATDDDLLRLLALTCAAAAAALTDPRTAALWQAMRTLVWYPDAAPAAWTTAVAAAAAALLRACADAGLAVPLSADELVAMAGRVNTNAHGVADPGGSNRTVGLGVFPLCAVLCHSCRPNCAHVAAGDGRLAIRAVRAIAAGEELTVSYIDLYQDRRQRRAQLWATKRFWCACERCACLAAPLPPDPPGWVAVELELDGVSCSACRVGVHSLSRADALVADIEAAQVPCSAVACTRLRPRAEVAAVLARAEEQLTAALAQRTSDPAGAERALKALVDGDGDARLPPRHVVVLSALPALLNLARRAGRPADAAAWCARVVACLDAVYPPAWAETSDFLQEQAEALLAAGEAVRAAAAAHRCVGMRRLCYGPAHAATVAAERLAARLPRAPV